MATKMLLEAGHDVELLGRREGQIQGIDIQNELKNLQPGEIDTVTLYVNPTHQEEYKKMIEALKPKRVIFNPGTVNPDWMEVLESKGIAVEAACTLVLLSTKQY